MPLNEKGVLMMTLMYFTQDLNLINDYSHVKMENILNKFFSLDNSVGVFVKLRGKVYLNNSVIDIAK